MSEQRLRAALDALAPARPLGDLASVARSRAARRARIRAAGLAGATALVLLTGVGVVLADGDRRVSTLHAVSPSPLPSADVATPDPAASPSPSPSPSPSASTASPSVTPSATGLPSPPQRPDPGGLDVAVTSTRRLVDGTWVATLRVDVHDTDATAMSLHVRYGDGTAALEEDGYPAAPRPCPSQRDDRPVALDRSVELHHAYRHAGTYRVEVRVVTGRPCVRLSDEADTVWVTVRIPDDSRWSNGPAQPIADATTAWSGNRLGVSADVSDADGWITRIEIDFHDGEPPYVTTVATEDCREPHDPTWPSSTRTTSVERSFPDPESVREVTVRVRSTGCDGSDEQRTEVTVPVERPAR